MSWMSALSIRPDRGSNVCLVTLRWLFLRPNQSLGILQKSTNAELWGSLTYVTKSHFQQNTGKLVIVLYYKCLTLRTGWLPPRLDGFMVTHKLLVRVLWCIANSLSSFLLDLSFMFVFVMLVGLQGVLSFPNSFVCVAEHVFLQCVSFPQYRSSCNGIAVPLTLPL